VLVSSSGGTLFVLASADEVRVVREVKFDEPLFATPAIADGAVYVRSETALYAFGK